MADWYPKQLAALPPWHNNFFVQAGLNGTTLGLIAGQVTQIGLDATNVEGIVDAVTAAEVFRQSVTAFKDEMFETEIGHAMPSPPDPPAKITLVGSLAAIEARTRLYAAIIKASPAYQTDDGELYGIVPPATGGPGTPALTGEALLGSQVRLRISKAGYDVLAIDSRRGGGGWEQIGVSQTAEYLDARAPLAPGAPEQREYRCQGMVDNVRVGVASAVIAVVTTP